MMLVICVLLMVNVLVELCQVSFQKSILDELAYTRDGGAVFIGILWLLAAYVAAAFLFYVTGMMTHRVFYYWREKMTAVLYERIQNMKIVRYEKERIASLTVLFTDIEQQGQALFQIQYKAGDLIKLLLVSVILARISYSVFFILLTFNAAAGVCASHFAKTIRKNGIEAETARFASQIRFEEAISGLRELITYQFCEEYIAKIRMLFGRQLLLVKRHTGMKNGLMGITEGMKWAGILVSLYLSWRMAASGQITVGTFYLVYQFSSQFNGLFKQMNDFRSNVAQTDARLQKLRDAVEKMEEEALEKGICLDEPITSLVFQNACYGHGEKEVLRNFCAEFVIGGKNALAGPSGSGKTTIANLLEKNYTLSGGRCLVNSKYDLGDISAVNWLKKIAIVYQDSYFFPDTIRNNLTFGNTRIEEERILEVCEKMRIREFVEGMPGGLDFYMGERGVNISGGQKQRLALVRALLRDPEILILDEATSALDEALERVVQGNIEALMAGRTLIVISHRPSLIEHGYKVCKLGC